MVGLDFPSQKYFAIRWQYSRLGIHDIPHTFLLRPLGSDEYTEAKSYDILNVVINALI